MMTVYEVINSKQMSKILTRIAMKCTISKDKVFKFLEWIFFIGLCIVCGWFASGVIKQFFSRKTSFAHYEEKFTKYPVITILLYSPTASEVNLTEVILTYHVRGIDYPKLQIGENLLHNEDHNKTEKIILQSFVRDDGNFRLGFRLIHATPILVKYRALGTIHLYRKLQNKSPSKNTSDLMDQNNKIYVLVTSRENSPGFFYWNWEDGLAMELTMNKNTYVKCNIQPQITKYLKETGKCQEESYYDCIASQLDAIEFNECSNKCIPNVFSNLGKNYSIPFCHNDIDNEICALKIVQKIVGQKFGYKCKKSCSKLEYFGEVITNEPYLSKDSKYDNWNAYLFKYVLRNQDFASKVYEEYFIYDIIGMIGSVGGTLGI